MHPDKDMARVISGKRYSVRTATLLASDEYWDGRNYERDSTNTFLYRTPRRAYFRVRLTQWQGHADTIFPLSIGEAKELYDNLPEHELAWEDAFNEVPTELDPVGRPTIYGEKMKQVTVWLPDDMVTWLKEQGLISETLRSLVRNAMTVKGWQTLGSPMNGKLVLLTLMACHIK